MRQVKNFGINASATGGVHVDFEVCDSILITNCISHGYYNLPTHDAGKWIISEARDPESSMRSFL